MGEFQPITPEVRQKTTVGVWLMFLTPDSKIFVVTNQKAKYQSQKVPGQINSPAESYDANHDNGSFLQTITRAIEEEVGEADFDPSAIRPIGLISFHGLESNVVAAPYLIPVKDTTAVHYNPADLGEGLNPRWINLDEVRNSQSLTIGQYIVPLYRSPMAEIAQMIGTYRNTGQLQIRHVNESIPKQVYESLKANSSIRLSA